MDCKLAGKFLNGRNGCIMKQNIFGYYQIVKLALLSHQTGIKSDKCEIESIQISFLENFGDAKGSIVRIRNFGQVLG
jgi:hypothetical protein